MNPREVDPAVRAMLVGEDWPAVHGCEWDKSETTDWPSSLLCNIATVLAGGFIVALVMMAIFGVRL